MEILRKLLKHPEFSAFLLLVCTALFGWPFISIPGPAAPAGMYMYLFLVWGAVIVLLFLISRALGEEHNGDGQPGSED